MAIQKWTENQQAAIKARSCSLLVSAAAGSGKTASLVQRVIERITDKNNPIDADRLLVVTYTRAAANEMRERIVARLDELINENAYDSALRRQLILLEKANICTVHSFCSNLIRQNFYRLNISSDFKIADDAELSVIRNSSLNNVLDELYESGDKDFYALVEAFSSAHDDKLLQKTVIKLYGFLLSHPFPQKWLDEKSAMYSQNVPAAQTVWGKSIINYAVDAVEYCIMLNEKSLELAADDAVLYEKISKQLLIDKGYLGILKDKLHQASWNDIARFIHSFENGRLSTPRGYANDMNKIKIASNRDVLKDVIKGLKELFAYSEESCSEDINELYPIVKSLFKTVKMFSDSFSKTKQEKGIADFSDLEHLTLRLLVQNGENGYSFTDIAYAVRESYDEVMVDEYQDVNEVQDIIFRAVSRDERNLFVVGDVKQSIYRFRQAMPEIFLRKKSSMQLYSDGVSGIPSKIILDKNFRSRKGIIDSVNFVFSRLMSEKAGDMEYTKEEQLVAGAVFPDKNDPDTELHILSLPNGEDMNITEAHHIADIILSMVNTYMISEGNSLRPATFGDFCILLRNANRHAPVFVKELGLLGIPAVSDSTESFLTTYEISVMLSMLNVLDNPIQDIPLLSLMMCPIYGFTPDEMTAIRLNCKNEKLYFAVKKAARNGDAHCCDFLNELDDLRQTAAVSPSDVLINNIYEKTGFTSIVQSMKNGNARLNNLRLLQEYAKNYEASGYKGLSGFIGFINRLSAQGGDLPSAGDSKKANLNAVRIMSIHKSKGLEFPICIVANMSRKINSDKSNDVLLHADLGLGIKRRDLKLMCRYNTMPRQAVALEIERDEKSEELRVLYVAMTRAKEKLIMLSSVKNAEKYITDLAAGLTDTDKLSPYTVLNAKSMSDWIVLCALLHKSGGILREAAGNPIYVPPSDDSLWNIKIYDTGEASSEIDTVEYTEAHDESIPENSEFFNTVKSRLSKDYKFSALSKLPVKVAASVLAAEEGDVEHFMSNRPAFMRESGMTPAERGTALHSFMQYADFKNAAASFENELQRLKESKFLTELECNAINRTHAEAFLKSSLMERINTSGKLYREFRFTTKIDAGRINKELTEPFNKEPVILQGAIDLAFEENGHIIIVDYKTDNVKTMEQLKKRYTTQLLLYKEAMEQCTGLKVKECILYSFKLDDFLNILE